MAIEGDRTVEIEAPIERCFEITRRGKPFARLLPPAAQLALVAAPTSAEADAA